MARKQKKSFPKPNKNQIEALVVAFTAYQQITGFKEKWGTWQRGRGFTVTILANDPVHDRVGKAVLDLLPPTRQKFVSVRSKRQDNGSLSVSEGYVATKLQTIQIEGYEVKVDLEQAEGVTKDPDDISTLMASLKPDKLRFWTSTYEGKTAVVRFIEEAAKSSPGPKLMSASRWGSWIDQSEVPPRSMSTVVLAEGQADDILADVKGFLQQEEIYSKMGLPWHRGYLLHGPPGTGKTSLVRALASELNLDLYAIALGSVRDDQTLMNLFQEVQPRSALLIEDIDTTMSARNRDSEGDGVSTSGLLNGLDGVGTPHGLIIFMTSNRRDVLDAALLRPGRCDREFEIGFLVDEQLAQLVTVFSGETPELPPVPDGVAPALVIELYKENIDTPERFVPALTKRLKEIANKT